jgi:hypothetical protein
MSEHPPSSSPGSRGGGGVAAVILLFVALLLPVLYVLSVGPVLYFAAQRGFESYEATADTFYWPLVELCEAIPALGDVVNRYVDWWVGDLL